MIRLNAAGKPELKILSSLEQIKKFEEESTTVSLPISDDEVDKKLAEKMNQLQLFDEEKIWREVERFSVKLTSPVDNPDEPINVGYSTLRGADLAIKTEVNVRTINNPTDFIVTWVHFVTFWVDVNWCQVFTFIHLKLTYKITLAADQQEYEKLLGDMNKFYLNAESYLTNDIVKDNIYVARRDDGNFARVRIISVILEVCLDVHLHSHVVPFHLTDFEILDQ